MRKNINFLLAFFSVTVAFLVLAQTAQACSCAMNDTVDKDFIRVPNIAIFKVQAVEKYTEGEKGYGYGGIKQSKLSVEKVFKGNLKVGQELTFAQGGGADCIWTFDEKSIGQEYLFYLGDKPIDNKSAERMISSTSFGRFSPSQNVWAAFTCSRSGSVRYRIGDVKYLENVSKERGKTRLSGILSQYVAVATEDEEAKVNPLSGYKITIKGSLLNIELKTDKDGFYEIYDLPAGKYTVTPEKISGYKFYGVEKDSIEVVVKPKSHTEQNFDYRINNRIGGKFYDANGKLLKDVCLDLIPARGKKARYFYQGDCTNENGKFEFDEIPAGTCLIVVNERNEISARQPFGTFYYPNKLNREEAALVTISAGDFRDDLIITAPTTAETITISGVLLFEDGKPAADEAVEFYAEGAAKKDAEDKSEDSRASTDNNGRFSIKILKGQKGRLLGSMITFEGEYEKCPKLDKLIKAKGGGVPTIETSTLQIEAVSDSTGIELKFPFPKCKKAKIE